MDYQIIWDDEALAELTRIIGYIASDNPTAARKFANEFSSASNKPALFLDWGKYIQNSIARTSGKFLCLHTESFTT
jgi:plasmid stabilization system protein ParE